MEITKGYTVEQFIDYIETIDCIKHCPELKSVSNADAIAYRLISDYNARLKEPLVKDMFINTYDPSKSCCTLDEDGIIIEEADCIGDWIEVEEKVMFRGWKEHALGFIRFNDYELWITDDDIMLIYSIGSVQLNTIGDLFRATNGELDLQNFNI